MWGTLFEQVARCSYRIVRMELPDREIHTKRAFWTQVITSSGRPWLTAGGVVERAAGLPEAIAGRFRVIAVAETVGSFRGGSWRLCPGAGSDAGFQKGHARGWRERRHELVRCATSGKPGSSPCARSPQSFHTAACQPHSPPPPQDVNASTPTQLPSSCPPPSADYLGSEPLRGLD